MYHITKSYKLNKVANILFQELYSMADYNTCKLYKLAIGCSPEVVANTYLYKSSNDLIKLFGDYSTIRKGNVSDSRLRDIYTGVVASVCNYISTHLANVTEL